MRVERMTTMHASSADKIGDAAARVGGIIRGGDCKYLVLSGANTVYVCTLNVNSGMQPSRGNTWLLLQVFFHGFPPLVRSCRIVTHFTFTTLGMNIHYEDLDVLCEMRT